MIKYVVDNKTFDTLEDAEKYEAEIKDKKDEQKRELAELDAEFTAITEEAQRLNTRWDEYEKKAKKYREKYKAKTEDDYDYYNALRKILNEIFI